jgi:RimJ/RimL family protein N-acetyltransferase
MSSGQRTNKMNPIETSRLQLVPLTRAQALADLENMAPEQRREVSPLWLERLAASGPIDPWIHGFVITSRSGEVRIGRCGFKAPPDAEGAVEIAYGIEPEQQGKGFATEAAAALSQYAYGTGLVRLVYAHTLPQPNASTHVLTKCGFTKVGEVIDPEDGLVWRWELQPAKG